MKVVIMAGGKGTRIANVNSNVPKPMLPIGEIPVLEREIEILKKQGFCELVITVGYLADLIIDYFGDGTNISPTTGKPFGVHIEYYREDKPLGNAGALFEIEEHLLTIEDDAFFLLNGDVVFDVDLNRMIEYHNQKHALATIFTHPNSHPYDSGVIVTNEDGLVTRWYGKSDIRPTYYKNRVNAGIHIVSRAAMRRVRRKYSELPFPARIDLDSMVLKPLVNQGLYAYDSPEYVKDMGTPERYYDVCRAIESNIVGRKNLLYKQKAIFLDRDGTINKYVGFLRNINDFELLPGVEKAVKIINQSEYLCIVVTNQPVVARGEVSYQELDLIHNKMETLLGEEGAYVDAIYFCPHHPAGGFDGEISDLKIDCECRKPKPGMLLMAAEKYNIDLSESYMIGDSKSDILAGKAAGCKTVLISDKGVCDWGQDYTISGLKDILKKKS